MAEFREIFEAYGAGYKSVMARFVENEAIHRAIQPEFQRVKTLQENQKGGISA